MPAEIGNLTELTELYLHNNKLIALPDDIGKLTNLKKLYLYNNNVNVLSKEILKLNLEINCNSGEFEPVREGIFLYGNPWKDPPKDIIKKGKAGIVPYFESARKRLYKILIIIVAIGLIIGVTIWLHK